MTLSTALRRSALSAAVSAAFVLCAPLSANAQSVELQLIGPVAVTDISADGKAATGQTIDDYETFRWTADGGIQRLGRNPVNVKGGFVAGTPGISDDGKTIGSSILDDSGSKSTQGRWTLAGGWQQLTPLPTDGGILDNEDGSVFGMSRDGKVVTGLYWRPGQSGGLAHGSVWRAATGMVGLATEGGSSRVDDGNRDGSVLVGWEESPTTGARLAAVWNKGVRTMLDPQENGSEAASVSADGKVIVGQSFDTATNRQVATVWTRSGSSWVARPLGVLKGTNRTGYSYATAVSDDGRIVVGFNRPSFNIFETSAFIWTEGTGMVDVMQFLRSRGHDIGDRFKINFLPAINGDGTVLAAIGKDVNPPFTQRSLLIKLVGNVLESAPR